MSPVGQDDDVAAAVNVDAKDTTCVNWAHKSPCQSGLPFFRMRSNEMSVEECFEFCLSKGLDLFGLVKGAECRCGASRLNRGVWRSADPRPGLELVDSDKIGSCATDEACPLRVYRWLGPFVSGGSVPEHLMMPRLEESVLVDSVVQGRLLNEGDEEDGPGGLLDADAQEIEPALTQHGGNASWAEGPAWHRLCDDRDGCQYARPWVERTTVAPEGMTPEWREYVIVRYKHDPETSTPTMREAFDAAAAEWRRHTCVALIEDPNAGYPRFKIKKSFIVFLVVFVLMFFLFCSSSEVSVHLGAEEEQLLLCHPWTAFPFELRQPGMVRYIEPQRKHHPRDWTFFGYLDLPMTRFFHAIFQVF